MSKLKHVALCLIAMFACASADGADLNLPDPLKTEAGQQVNTADQWRQKRRPEILELFRTHIYGRMPIGRPKTLKFVNKETNENAMGGAATLKRIDIGYSGPGGKGVIRLGLFVPNRARKPAPAFVLICNRGPSNIDMTRSKKSPFWPAERIVERGYVAAAFCNADVDPDKHDGFKNGVHGIFDPKDKPRSADAWGTIAAWAWGASRVMDYFESDPDVDAKRIGVVGHSRGGKTALWCGAEDERFAMAISNNSGCTGAALTRNKKGESVGRINKGFPHWFNTNYKKFKKRVDELPIDQHQLIALMAPRLVYVASASKDRWADPEGEFLSCVHASPVYRLFGLKGVGATKMPPVEQPLHTGHIGHHIREGKHNLTEYDWDRYMDFADKHGKMSWK